jgi:uncharacterized protein YciI
MKLTLTIFIHLLSLVATAQPNFPLFLEGTWKMEDKEIYEHWDKLNNNTLKGISYSLDNGKISVIEYLDIYHTKKDIILSASVKNQNEGKSINFKLTRNGNSFKFENPKHDFPKVVEYQILSDNEMFVQVSDGKEKGFSYKMHKQVVKITEKDTTVANPNYDGELAQKLGADDYGMKSYFLVMLKTGPNQTTDKDFISRSFSGHLANITRLADEGKLIVAGPLGKNDKTYRGIFILSASTIEEAELLLDTDPAIKEGLLDAEIFKWYGSAALPEYLKASDKIWKKNF